MSDGADDEAVTGDVVIKRAGFVAGAAAVDRHGVVSDEMVVVEGNKQGAVIAVTAEVHAAGAVHHDGAHPIGAQGGTVHLEPDEEAVGLVEGEELFHGGMAVARGGDDDLVGADGGPGPGSVVGALDVAGAEAGAAVEGGNNPGVSPVKSRLSAGEVVLQGDIGVGHEEERAGLLEEGRGHAG